jgi:hypothetical protein
MWNMREAKSRMDGLRTEVASLWDGSDHKGLEGIRNVRWGNSHFKKSITKNTNNKSKDFDDNNGGRLWPHRNQRPNKV